MNPTPGEALTQLVLALFRAHQALSAEGDALAGRWGLSTAKWKVMGALALAGEPLSAAGIGRAMGLSRQAAQKQINALLEDGLVQRRPDPADARAPLHTLTPQGQAAYDAVSLAWQQRAERLAAATAAQPELLQAAGLVARMTRALETLPLPPDDRSGPPPGAQP